METITFSDFRQNLKNAMDLAFENHEELIVTRKENKSMVVMSLDDYNALKETVYLLSSKANAKHIQDSIDEFEKGEAQTRELINE